MKIKAICRHEIVYKNGKSPLAIRFTHQRTHKTVSLGISVEPHYWDKTAEMITANCPERAALQSQIDSTLAGYRKKIQRLEALDIPVTFDTLFETDKSRHAGITIEDGFNAEIERLESLGKINSATKHKYALQVLNGYKSVKTALEAIDLDYLKGLELHLRQRGNKDNSIATRFAIFKAIYNKAVKEGKVAVKQNPFSIYQVHDALERLKECRHGAYFGPLRLLALEVYDKLNTEGLSCSMVTGEETLEVPGAVCQSCTVEMLNDHEYFDIVVVDECQMIADPYRGHNWTRAVLGLRAEEIHLSRH